MKKIFLTLLFLFITSVSFSQSAADLTGNWKEYVKASGFKENNITPTYMILNEDFTFIRGIDSAASDPMKETSTGKWSLTDDGLIKIIPDDTASEIRYYKPSGENRYKYEFTEKDGKKVRVQMLEMDIFMEKIPADPSR
ncbi:MAG: hypothetical protein JSS91_10850 [Bacteroidetes bacterium]|nr:hypothetical protein [Bacteroidota bacterium]